MKIWFNVFIRSLYFYVLWFEALAAARPVQGILSALTSCGSPRIAGISTMVAKVLPIFSLFLLSYILLEQNLESKFYRFSPKSQTTGPAALYEAMVTGDKSGVSKQTIKSMKDFGLMHLLTPSGLHLGSFLLLFKFFPRLKFLVVGLLWTGSFFMPGFLALKRMLIFYLINHWTRKPKLSFMATAFASLALGNYAQSPMSFAFSMLFWGAILFHEGGKFRLAVTLFALQAFVALLFNQEISLAALIVNPAVTAAFTLLFPLLLAAYPFSFARPAGMAGIEAFEAILQALNTFAFLNVSGSTAIAFALLILPTSRKLALAGMIFYSINITDGQEQRRKASARHYPLPHHLEFLEVKGQKIEFLDRSCSFKTNGDYFCKKKPSRRGGLSL